MKAHFDAMIPRATSDPVPSLMPAVFRVQAVERDIVDGRSYRNRAHLFHEQTSLNVDWLSRKIDERTGPGSLVYIRWSGDPVAINGATRISRLLPVERVRAEIDLFDTVPPTWVKKRELIIRAKQLYLSLPRSYRRLFNAIMWNDRRFQRYLMGPSSLMGHHNGVNGNLQHSIEVAELAVSLGNNYPFAFAPILAIGGLLHDAGKADEYQFNRRHMRFEMSEWGDMVGHRNTLLGWIVAAIEMHRVDIPAKEYLSLVHALSAAKGAPSWLGLREPRNIEATILSMADRMSGHGDLYDQLAPAKSGYGKYHRHIGGKPYFLVSEEAVR